MIYLSASHLHLPFHHPTLSARSNSLPPFPPLPPPPALVSHSSPPRSTEPRIGAPPRSQEDAGHRAGEHQDHAGEA